MKNTSWAERERKRIRANSHKAQILKVNRRLTALSNLAGIPLHQLRTRRLTESEILELVTPRAQSYITNEDTGETVMEGSVDHFTSGTECMIERTRKESKGCDVIQKILAPYNLKLVAARNATWRGRLRVNAISVERINERKEYDHNAA
jgi:hypothetical protein